MKEAWAVKPENIKPEEVSAVYDADIVVIGAGHAGTCAARAAAEAGAGGGGNRTAGTGKTVGIRYRRDWTY